MRMSRFVWPEGQFVWPGGQVRGHCVQVRMNMANNMAAGERTDVWVVRHCGRQPGEYYGFDVSTARMYDGEVANLYTVRYVWK